MVQTKIIKHTGSAISAGTSFKVPLILWSSGPLVPSSLGPLVLWPLGPLDPLVLYPPHHGPLPSSSFDLRYKPESNLE